KGDISPGNAAASTRADFGRLYLRLGSSGVEVAEELSLWEAIICSPHKLRVLSPPEFERFCGLMIKAVETANAHYGALVPTEHHLASAQTTNHAFRRRVMWAAAGAMATAAAIATLLVVPHNVSLPERLVEEVAKFYSLEPVTSIEANKAESTRRRQELSKQQE